jgi:hypothetical protein
VTSLRGRGAPFAKTTSKSTAIRSEPIEPSEKLKVFAGAAIERYVQAEASATTIDNWSPSRNGNRKKLRDEKHWKRRERLPLDS